jgi:hypothetical protein
VAAAGCAELLFLHHHFRNHRRGAFQRAVNRAFVGNLQQTRPLLKIERAPQGDPPAPGIYLVTDDTFRVLRVHLVVAHIDRHFFERPALAPRIHADGHVGAGPKPR